jgi:hypothetical protein
MIWIWKRCENEPACVRAVWGAGLCWDLRLEVDAVFVPDAMVRPAPSDVGPMRRRPLRAIEQMASRDEAQASPKP